MHKPLATLLLILILSLASPLLAQVPSEKIPADIPRGLAPVIQPAILWGAAVLFSLLILIMAFKAPKRNFYDPKA